MLFDGDYAILVTGNENGGISAAHYKRLIIPLFFPPVKAGVFIFRPVRRLFSVKAPKTPRRAALCRFRGRDRRGRSLPVQDILHPRRRRKVHTGTGTERRKRPSPLPHAGEQGRSFQLFFGRSEREMGHFFSSCSCRETRSIMRAYPSAPYTRHLRTRVIVAEETPVCSLMALNVSPS